MAGHISLFDWQPSLRPDLPSGQALSLAGPHSWFVADSPVERDGFELVVPDFRETFLLYRFRAANWPGPTAGLMTNLVTPLGSPLMAAF
jgi:hypothetical protein